MRIKETIICILLSLATVFSAFAAIPASAEGGLTDKYNYIYENGYSVPKTKDFMDAFLVFGSFY